MIEILISIALGVLVGIFTGLLPGLHPNNVSAILIPLLPFMLTRFSATSLLSFVVSLFVTHSFTSFIASVISGVPEEATALTVLPAHRMVLDGKACEAVYLTVLGGLLSIVFVLILLPALLLVLEPLYERAIKFLPMFLTIFLVYFIFIQKDRVKAAIIVTLSGILGYLVLNLYFLKSYEKLTAMFSGLFGASFIVISLFKKSRIPEQDIKIEEKGLYIKESFLGTIGAILASIFPSLSPSQSITILQNLFKVNGVKEFLVMIGALTTADIVISLVSLYSFGNPRTGLAAFVEYIFSNLRFETLMFLIGVTLVSTSLASVATMYVARYIIEKIQKVNYFYFNILILFILVAVIYYLSGLVGILIFITSTCLGIIAILSEVNVSLLVAVLMVPLIVSFVV